MRFLSVFLIAFLLTACDPALTFIAGEDWQQDGQVFTQTHWSGSNADASATTTIVARNQAEWENLWQRVATKPPGILPHGKMAVAVLLGQRPNPGYRVEILKAGKEYPFGQIEHYTVEYRTFEPNPNKAYIDVLSSPWAIRLADFSEGVADFREVD